ncbi:MAG: thermonuclease family protein [Desulfobacterales bacterium]|nr:thermonuclease family protein [Desulfobacterales bacterium]
MPYLKKSVLSVATIFTIVFAILPFAKAAPVINGKVFGVSDGDTITVLQERIQYKIRLYGIDCPESHQDFGTRAKQFTSELVFKKQVRVVQKDMDRYGRVVGLVFVDGTCINDDAHQSCLAQRSAVFLPSHAFRHL